MSRVTVELHDGRSFEYANKAPETIIEDLIARGVRLPEIKNTIHHIARNEVLVNLAALAKIARLRRREP